MAFRISYKLSRAQHDAAYEFYKQVLQGAEADAPGPTTFDEFAKQCLFYTINKCREEAKVLAAAADKIDGGSDGITADQNTKVANAEVPISQDASADSLADSSQSGDPSPSQQ